jgi:hypothetical protein
MTTIDGKDILQEYGCTLLKGSYSDLFRYPKRKAVPYNNWAEADGIEPDLSTVEFEPKTVKLNFLIQAASVSEFLSRYNKLISVVSAPGVRKFGFDFGKTYELRYNVNSAYKYPCAFNEGKNMSVFTLEFTEDGPSIPPASTPIGGISSRGAYVINGYDFGLFGIGSEKGFEDALKYPSAKSPFTDGNTVYLSTVRMQHKEIKLSLWMTANNKTEFFNNHAAFFYQLSQTGTQELKIKGIGTIYAYYTDCTDYGIELWNESKIASRFTITLTVPVVTWIDAGGETVMRVLLDTDFGYLADENKKVITINNN